MNIKNVTKAHRLYLPLIDYSLCVSRYIFEPKA